MKPSEDTKLKSELSQCFSVIEELHEDKEYSIETVIAVFEKRGYKREV